MKCNSEELLDVSCTENNSVQCDQIAFIEVSITGSAYDYDLEREIDRELSRSYNIIVRGQQAPAAGPELLIDFYINVVQPAIIDFAAEKILSTLYSKIKTILMERGVLGSCVSKVALCSKEYELIIFMIPDDNDDVSQVDLNDLVGRANRFVDKERREGNHVLSISLPNEYDVENGFQEGFGSMNIWHIQYKDGERLYSSYYDAENDCFLE